jgi:hypothetical protein
MTLSLSRSSTISPSRHVSKYVLLLQNVVYIGDAITMPASPTGMGLGAHGALNR